MLVQTDFIRYLVQRGLIDPCLIPDSGHVGEILGMRVYALDELPERDVVAYVNAREFGFLCGALRDVIDVLSNDEALFSGKRIRVREGAR